MSSRTEIRVVACATLVACAALAGCTFDVRETDPSRDHPSVCSILSSAQVARAVAGTASESVYDERQKECSWSIRGSKVGAGVITIEYTDVSNWKDEGKNSNSHPVKANFGTGYWVSGFTNGPEVWLAYKSSVSVIARFTILPSAAATADLVPIETTVASEALKAAANK